MVNLILLKRVNFYYFLTCTFFIGLNLTAFAQVKLTEQEDRWTIKDDGSIYWKLDKRLPHIDHIEMSGEKVSMWVEYGIDADGRSNINRTLVFPTYRMLPDATRTHISYTFSDQDLPRFYINNRQMKTNLAKSGKSGDLSYKITEVNHKGVMKVNAESGTPVLAQIERKFYPSVDQPIALEKFVFTNATDKDMTIAMEYLKKEIRTDSIRSKVKQHSIIMGTIGAGSKVLAPGKSVTFAVYYLATDYPNQLPQINPDAEEMARIKRISGLYDKLQLVTPDKVLNTMFDFAKIRATESIFKTKGGYMHGPGGLAYYAAIWANDQAEYVNPFFAFLGDEVGNKSAMNAYRWFAKYMNPDYKAIPSSIVAEGDGVWKGAGDRGDQAMIAYGASRYALTYGNIDSAKVLWPLIEWCLAYSHKKLNAEGVVTSDADELENRFPAGKANLTTNSLYYDALRSAALLGKLLGKPNSQIETYTKQADILRINMEKYYGANVEGFDTYRYYETNTTLRAWICMPLTVGIFDRKQGTIDALFSPRLWTADGLATEAGKVTFWDRSTLYALRGVFAAGETEKAMDFLKYYSRRRLLGEHVPYAVEAYPEGNQRHLSAESGLYCRIYTEGLFGIRPTAFNGFDCTPRLPKDWNEMALNNVSAFGNLFNVKVERVGSNQLKVTVRSEKKTKSYMLKDGATCKVIL